MTLLTTHNPIRPLPETTASELMHIFIDQDTDALLVGACLALLAQRVPEAHELAAFAEALSQVAVPFPPVPEEAIDVVGTGGDGASTANLSTLTAMFLPAYGVPVVKHGNRAATGVCGSADLMEALGYDLSRAVSDLEIDLRERRFAFLFAPTYHPLMGRLREIRRRLGIPTIFNLLGPLINPANPPRQLLGVAREELVAPMAGALARRPTLRRAFVVHGKDAEGKGLDEVSIEGPTTVLAVVEGRIQVPQVLVPRELGVTPPARHALRVEDRAEALAVAQGIFGGVGHADFRPAVADAVALQAALGLALHRDGSLEGLAGVFHDLRAALDRGFAPPFPAAGVH